MAIVYVELEFESDDVTNKEVRDYLYELSSSNRLVWFHTNQKIRDAVDDYLSEDDDWLTNYNNADEHEIYGVNPLDYEK